MSTKPGIQELIITQEPTGPLTLALRLEHSHGLAAHEVAALQRLIAEAMSDIGFARTNFGGHTEVPADTKRLVDLPGIVPSARALFLTELRSAITGRIASPKITSNTANAAADFFGATLESKDDYLEKEKQARLRKVYEYLEPNILGVLNGSAIDVKSICDAQDLTKESIYRLCLDVAGIKFPPLARIPDKESQQRALNNFDEAMRMSITALLQHYAGRATAGSAEWPDLIAGINILYQLRDGLLVGSQVQTKFSLRNDTLDKLIELASGRGGIPDSIISRVSGKTMGGVQWELSLADYKGIADQVNSLFDASKGLTLPSTILVEDANLNRLSGGSYGNFSFDPTDFYREANAESEYIKQNLEPAIEEEITRAGFDPTRGTQLEFSIFLNRIVSTGGFSQRSIEQGAVSEILDRLLLKQLADYVNGRISLTIDDGAAAIAKNPYEKQEKIIAIKTIINEEESKTPPGLVAILLKKLLAHMNQLVQDYIDSKLGPDQVAVARSKWQEVYQLKHDTKPLLIDKTLASVVDQAAGSRSSYSMEYLIDDLIMALDAVGSSAAASKLKGELKLHERKLLSIEARLDEALPDLTRKRDQLLALINDDQALVRYGKGLRGHFGVWKRGLPIVGDSESLAIEAERKSEDITVQVSEVNKRIESQEKFDGLLRVIRVSIKDLAVKLSTFMSNSKSMPASERANTIERMINDGMNAIQKAIDDLSNATNVQPGPTATSGILRAIERDVATAEGIVTTARNPIDPASIASEVAERRSKRKAKGRLRRLLDLIIR